MPDYKDPLLISLTGMMISILIALTVLSLWKPKFIMKELFHNDSSEKKEKLDWKRYISVSIGVGIVTGMILYFLFMKKPTREEKQNRTVPPLG